MINNIWIVSLNWNMKNPQKQASIKIKLPIKIIFAITLYFLK
jgi:hypothetical protein